MQDRTLLVVEDNPDHLELTLLTLENHRVANRIVVARDGVQALDYLFGTGEHAGRDTSVQPEVILLDLKLPKISGHEVLQRVRADPRTALVPVVILTSSSEEEDIVSSYKSGANSFVRKPIDFQEFTQRLQNLQMYWLIVNSPPP
ncbi:MAG: response regulator [Burkholderiaceae bacterium]|nr:response regulator [Burkholderiaceae bacterium]